jgi:hypothetical protein
VTLVFHEAADVAGGAFYGHDGDRAAIVVSPGLGRVERRCHLGHELVHDERRITSPSATDATMEREEVIVRREAARRLVPLAELQTFVEKAVEAGEAVSAGEIAREFDVTEAVATEAARLLEAAHRTMLEAALGHSASAGRRDDAAPPESGPSSSGRWAT